MGRFHHAVCVRNRTYGPVAGTTVSPYLDVEQTPDNIAMLRLKPDDINMYRVLQQSTCKKNNKRRKVARRCLTALGGASGVARFVNDDEALKEIKMNLKFAASVEEVKHAEKNIKLNKAKQVREKFYKKARKKCKVQANEKFFKSHAEKLTINELKAVAFEECGGATLKGKLQDMRQQLADLLPADPCDDSTESEYDAPDYATQDEVYSEVSSDSGEDLHVVNEAKLSIAEAKRNAVEEAKREEDDEDRITVDVPLEDMHVGLCVEVYWSGEGEWFEGEVTGINLDDKQFEVHYHTDSQQLWHNCCDYPVRISC